MTPNQSPQRTRVDLGRVAIVLALPSVAGTLLGFLGRYHWFADLFSHFRMQYFVALVLLAAVTAVYRHPRSATALFLVALLNGMVIAPLYFGGSRPDGDGRDVRILLSNVLTEGGNPTLVAEAIAHYAPDVVVLEEVSAEWLDALAQLKTVYTHYAEAPSQDNFGIALFSKWPLADVEIPYIGEASVPSIVAHVETPNGIVAIVGTHPMPPVGREMSRLRDEQLIAVGKTVANMTGPRILIGDLNTSPWSPAFAQLVAVSGLRDSAKGFGPQPTWPDGWRLWPLRIPLDHCLYSNDLAVVSRQVGMDVGSDHYPIIVDFVFSQAG